MTASPIKPPAYTKAGSEILAAQIVSYWHSRGYEMVKVWVIEVGHVRRKAGQRVYGVRSNVAELGLLRGAQ